MDNWTLLLIAVGLAMDAFAVATATGIQLPRVTFRHNFRLAWHFGLFQGMNTILGWTGGLAVRSLIDGVDHWIAFLLLLVIGGKMIYESFKIKSAGENPDPSNIIVLLILSVATSIDALAIGITLSIITSSIAIAVTIIGLITFVLSYIGVLIGKRFGHFFENKIEAVGGLVLIGIGVKILCEHLIF